jgi:hypothetical protein
MTNRAPGQGGVERDPSTLASHVTAGGTLEMLRRCLSVNASVRGSRVDIAVLADNVGHRVPTGFIDRNLIAVVEAFDKQGRAVLLSSGPVLPAAALDLAGKAGKIYAKQLTALNDPTPLPFWQPHEELLDTRLVPGRADRFQLQFASAVHTAKVRLLYRRFWSQAATVAWEKHFKQDD